MGQLDKKVKKLIEDEYEGAEADVDLNPRTSRVVGSVVWDGFQGKEHIDRQAELRQYLKRKLGDNIVNVGILFLYTPDELRIMQAA